MSDEDSESDDGGGAAAAADERAKRSADFDLRDLDDHPGIVTFWIVLPRVTGTDPDRRVPT